MSTALRQKFIDYMTLRRLSPRTQKAYTNAVAGFATYFHKSPDTLDSTPSICGQQGKRCPADSAGGLCLFEVPDTIRKEFGRRR